MTQPQGRRMELFNRARESMKHAVTSATVLRYFNSSELVEGQGDASVNGIGFVLMQNGQPVFK